MTIESIADFYFSVVYDDVRGPCIRDEVNAVALAAILSAKDKEQDEPRDIFKEFRSRVIEHIKTLPEENVSRLEHDIERAKGSHLDKVEVIKRIISAREVVNILSQIHTSTDPFRSWDKLDIEKKILSKLS